MHKCIDAPRPDQAGYDECISIAGWVCAGERTPAACRARAWLDNIPIGETRLLFARPDLSVFATRSAYCIPLSGTRVWMQRGVARRLDRTDCVMEWRWRRISNW